MNKQPFDKIYGFVPKESIYIKHLRMVIVYVYIYILGERKEGEGEGRR
jgi:hypothetical protein